MPRQVRCKGCRKMVPSDECLRYGLGYVCNFDCAKLIDTKRKESGHKVIRARPQPSPRGSGGYRQPTNGTTPADVRQAVRARDGNRCRVCGKSGGLHVHHIILRSHQGPHEMWNLVTLCFACHEMVHRHTRRYQPLLLELVEMTESEFLLLPALEARHASL